MSNSLNSTNPANIHGQLAGTRDHRDPESDKLVPDDARVIMDAERVDWYKSTQEDTDTAKASKTANSRYQSRAVTKASNK